MRELGAHAVGQLQARKVSDVEVIASGAIEPSLLATFHHSFMLSNYEWSQKGDVEDEDEKKDDTEEEVDERTKRKQKTLDSFTIEHEADPAAGCEDYNFSLRSAEATNFARNLANTRGSEANPGWMETQITDLLAAKSCDKVRDVRVIKGQELVDLEMNLFHSVGKSAISEPRAVIVSY
mmetsp:Transcript_7237/g.10140  ORF Transcript_7237/g.10140 Transcript_7237/m.10140 type:complete len:179 (-) Transcript_7237:819-1355(-)